MGHLLTSLGQLRLKEMCLLQECAITEFYWLHWVRAAPIRIEEMDDPLRHIQLPGFTELFFLRAQGIRFVGVESRFILGFVFFFHFASGPTCWKPWSQQVYFAHRVRTRDVCKPLRPLKKEHKKRSCSSLIFCRASSAAAFTADLIGFLLGRWRWCRQRWRHLDGVDGEEMDRVSMSRHEIRIAWFTRSVNGRHSPSRPKLPLRG